MADFRQLALEFVLAEDDAELTPIAQQAASELQNGSANSNPVARWVEAVQPWMPGGNVDSMADTDETPDWTGRAKALDFLSRTLEFVGQDVLKASQVKLLVAFFSAMFDIDHKAGILASATALSRIVGMKAFQPSNADDIIQKVCALKDDFPRQVATTRLAVFKLLQSLITSPGTASALQHKYGAPSGFINDLIQLCRNERDPSCLMVWFDILAFFLHEYSPSTEIIEEVFGTFKAYFPISLPRTSQSGITPEELKVQLRKCFTSNRQLAPLAFTFLLGKLDQGDGVTVNVKVDILRTINACLEEFDHPNMSVTPYVDQIWSSLKYEVRNGEIEDTIWATLEVLKTIATRLKGDNLRDFSLTVTRDCVNDLSNAMYTASAGRLLVSVMSATPGSFLLMVSPVITHVKENLRHPKAASHSQDLLKPLHVILETRILLVEAEMLPQERSDFAAIDTIFQSLYDDVYRKPVDLGTNPDASDDDLKLSTQAVQGAGALVCQQPAASVSIGSSESTEKSSTGRLLSGEKCSEICDVLFSIITQTATGAIRSQSAASDELVNETTKALQRAVTAFPSGFPPLVHKAVGIIRDSWSKGDVDAVSVVQTLCPIVAFVGCSELPPSPADGLSAFILTSKALHTELVAAIDSNAEVKVWCALAAGLQAAIRCFNDACKSSAVSSNEISWDNKWLSTISTKYPELQASDIDTGVVTQTAQSATQAYGDFLLISLYLARDLYRKATKEVASHPRSGLKALDLSDNFVATADRPAETQYLYLVSALAGFVFGEMSEGQQLSLNAPAYALHMFHEDFITLESGGVVGENVSPWDWILSERINVLSFGILEALRPASVAKLFDLGIAQQLLIGSVTVQPSFSDPATASVSRSILTILANRHKIETVGPVMEAIERECEKVAQQPGGSGMLDKATSIFAIAAGVLRRYSGKQVQGIIRLLREAPGYPNIGQNLARRLEMVIAPQKVLAKENHAVVKPLWMQKVYIELAKPLIPKALGRDAQVTDRVVRTNCSIGVLLMIKHMGFSIYEEDAEDILRIAITVAQTIGKGPDAAAALDALRSILADASDKGEPHLPSIISICVSAFSQKPQTVPEWLPADYVPSTAAGGDSTAMGGKAALEIMAALPKMYESRHLVPLAARVERELTLACGNAIRELRKSARAARLAWKEIR